MHQRSAWPILLVILTVLMTGASLNKSHAEAAGIQVQRDIEYGVVDGISLKLDAYLPTTAGPHPALIHIHGGGWQGGDKDSFGRQGAWYAHHGVAAFSLNYRLSWQATYPAAVDDCLRAIRWIRSHADNLNINPDRLAARGGSAGGHLALMMAFLEPGQEDLNAAGKPLKNFLCCVASRCGPTDFTDAEIIHADRGPLRMFMGGGYDEVPNNYTQASPVTHLSPDDPPVLMAHGTEDRTVPYSQALILQNRLREVGVPGKLITIEGGGHGFQGGDRQDIHRANERIQQFILQHLYPAYFENKQLFLPRGVCLPT